MRLRHALAVFVAAITVSAGPAARAEDQAPVSDVTKLSAACMGAKAFLLGDVPEGIDANAALTPLCNCLAKEFSAYPQNEVELLTADLDGSATDASRKAYAGYKDLAIKAQNSLTICFALPEVTSALKLGQKTEAPKQ